MKPAPQFQPLRSAVIFAHTRRMLDQTAQCARKFATEVAEQYMHRVAPDQRTVPFRWGVTLDDMFKAQKHNGQIVLRYMDGTVKTLPADLEDAWIVSLPEPYRSACEHDLAARRDRLTFTMPAASTTEAAAIAPVLTEVGELVAAWGSAIADNHITTDELLKLVRESDDVMAAVMQLRQYAQARAEVPHPARRQA